MKTTLEKHFKEIIELIKRPPHNADPYWRGYVDGYTRAYAIMHDTNIEVAREKLLGGNK